MEAGWRATKSVSISLSRVCCFPASLGHAWACAWIRAEACMSERGYEPGSSQDSTTASLPPTSPSHSCLSMISCRHADPICESAMRTTMYIEGLGPSITVQRKEANEKQLFWSFSKQEIKLLLCLSHYLVLVLLLPLYQLELPYTRWTVYTPSPFTFYLWFIISDLKPPPRGIDCTLLQLVFSIIPPQSLLHPEVLKKAFTNLK